MKLRLPEIKFGDGRHRLGRNINHDPRSLRYLVPPARKAESATWERRIPILDQGDLGSCTGNAETGMLGTDPFFDTLGEIQNQLNEDYAVNLYHLATQIDPYEGEYPPDDTGSDGLSVSKAAQSLNVISGYQWATNVDEAMTMIGRGPFITGQIWTTNCDRPNSEGIIRNPAKGTIRGGHEYQCFKYDSATDLWWFYNSWGDSWGKAGTFAYDSAGFTALMAQGGDITQGTPITFAPPEPEPADPDLEEWWTDTKPWTLIPHKGHGAAAQAWSAALALAKAKGFSLKK